MSELYPIRLFKWRDEDDRRTEGRSEKELPGWVLSGRELKKHADLLREKLVGLVKPFRRFYFFPKTLLSINCPLFAISCPSRIFTRFLCSRLSYLSCTC